jgi:hypothetical protein
MKSRVIPPIKPGSGQAVTKASDGPIIDGKTGILKPVISAPPGAVELRDPKE